MTTETAVIDGLTVHATPLAVHPHGFLLGAELLAIAAPALAKLEPAIAGLKLDLADPGALAQLAAAVLERLGLDVIIQALGEAIGGLGHDRDRALRVTAQLFRCLTVELPTEGGKLAMTSLANEGSVNLAVGRSYARYTRLLWFALKANFTGPFVVGSSGSSSATAGGLTPTG